MFARVRIAALTGALVSFALTGPRPSAATAAEGRAGEARRDAAKPGPEKAASVARDPGRAARTSSRGRTNKRTGLLEPSTDELVRAVRKKDRAAIERAVARLGAHRLGNALWSSDPEVAAAALAAVPLARDRALLIETLPGLLASKDPQVAAGAARALGTALDASVPSGLQDWDVPPDVVGAACGSLRALALRTDAASELRVAAVDALGQAADACAPGGELAPLLRDPSPELRRAVALVLRPSERTGAAALKDGMRHPDARVASAATAVVCRSLAARELAAPASSAAIWREPLARDAIAAARVHAAAKATPVEDAIEMLPCLAAGGTPADRAILDQLRRGPESPLQTRAAELAGDRDRLGPR